MKLNDVSRTCLCFSGKDQGMPGFNSTIPLVPVSRQASSLKKEWLPVHQVGSKIGNDVDWVEC